MSTFIYNSSTVVNQTIYRNILRDFYHTASDVIATNYGVFAGKAVVIVNIPIALASAMAAAMIPMISGSFAKGDEKETNQKIQSGIRTTMLISIPCAVGMFVLPKPIMKLLFSQKESFVLASNLLRVLSISVIFYALSTLSNGVLQGIGRVNKPVINAGIALVLQTVVLVVLLLVTDLGLYSLAVAMIVYSLTVCVLNQMSIQKCLGYSIDWGGTFIKPLIASLIMGAFALGTYRLVNLVVPYNAICLFTAIGVAVGVYFVLVIKMSIVSEAEMLAMPKGGLIVRVAKKCRLL